MYHNFFGLSEQAFSIAVNPRYLYMSEQHREALAHLLYGIKVGGFVMLTGEVGTGKTTIIRCLLDQLPENTDIAIILNPMASAPELLCTICDELGVQYIIDHWGVKDLTDALHNFLLENHRKGRKTVLLIDEAQLLKPTVMEQIRLLTNLETTTEKLLQIILVGQPELKKLLARPSLRQLSQRITARFHLEALSLAETHAYIAHRLRIAGLAANRNPFPDTIIKRIHHFSGGIPRLINIICERILLGAFGKNRTIIDDEIFEQAVQEVSGTKPPAPGSGNSAQKIWLYAGLGIAFMGIVVGLSWSLLPPRVVLPATIAVVEPVPQFPTPVSSEPDSSSASSAQSSVVEEPASSVITSSATPEPDTQSEQVVFWTRNENRVQKELLTYVGVDDINSKNPCGSLSNTDYICDRTDIKTWDDLKDINRPSVLTLITPDKKTAYVLIIGLGEENALLLKGGTEFTVPWTDIAEMWKGELIYAWHRPEGFESPLAAGQRGSAVNWLAEQFAALDQQKAPLARNIYNDKLKKRVELFQAGQGIKPDGVVGVQTLRRLNEVLGKDKVLVEMGDITSGVSTSPEG